MTFGPFDQRLLLWDVPDSMFMHVEPIEYAFRVTCPVRTLLRFLTDELGTTGTRTASTDVYFDSPDFALHRTGQSLRARTYTSKSFALINVGWMTGTRAPWPRKNCAIGQVFRDDSAAAEALPHIKRLGLVEIHRASKQSHTIELSPRTPVTQHACDRLVHASDRLRHVVSGYSVSVDEIFVGDTFQQTVLEIEFGPDRAHDAAALCATVLARFGDAMTPVRRNKIDRLIREGSMTRAAAGARRRASRARQGSRALPS